MLEPEEQLKNISLDEEVYDVLCTPNRIKFKENEFEGWSSSRENPLNSPEKKPQLNPIKRTLKINSSRLYTSEHPTARKMNIQNKENFSISPYEVEKTIKIMHLIDEQMLSPKSRKIITPNERSSHQSSQKFCIPKTSHRTRDISIRKISNTEKVKKDCFTDEIKETLQKNLSENEENFDAKRESQLNSEKELKEESFKIPLETILYPVLKMNVKKPVRRMERFHSFIARTVRK